MQKFIVIEIQTSSEGVVSTLPFAFDSIEEALAKYYAILSVAAVSSVPIHSCVLLSNEGIVQENKCFNRVMTPETM